MTPSLNGATPEPGQGDHLVGKVWALQHSPCETLGTIAGALLSAGIAAEYVRTFEGQPVPVEMADATGLIVMGGPMGVYDHPRYPFLRNEMRLIERALRDERPVLGICLGSQLLADAMGARVTRAGRKEIGWYPVRLLEAAKTDPVWAGVDGVFTAYHWHGDIFELPRGAVSLAASDMTACQAFRCGPSAYGILFHPEVTGQILQDMVTASVEELEEEHVDGREIVTQAAAHLPRLQHIGGLLFQRWAGLVGRRDPAA